MECAVVGGWRPRNRDNGRPYTVPILAQEQIGLEIQDATAGFGLSGDGRSTMLLDQREGEILKIRDQVFSKFGIFFFKEAIKKNGLQKFVEAYDIVQIIFFEKLILFSFFSFVT